MLKYNPEEVEKYLNEEVYTNVVDISDELKKRWSNKSLHKKVEDFLGEELIPEIKGKQRAFQSKYIFTPNKEFEHFNNIAEMLNLDTLLLEYQGKFVARNIEKYYLAKLFFLNGFNKHKKELYKSKRIVDFNFYEGNPMQEVLTLWGEKLSEFHHNLLKIDYPKHVDKIYFFDEWFDKNKNLGGEWYTAFMSFFIVHGVLFENYLHDDPEENIFIMEKLKPSLEKIKEIYGVKPLITSSVPIEWQESRYWSAFDNKYLEVVEKLLASLEKNS